MGAVFCFLLFLAAVGLCILLGQSLILAIWVGIAAFAALGLRRGMTVRPLRTLSSYPFWSVAATYSALHLKKSSQLAVAFPLVAPYFRLFANID